jgi:hypothetical protein
MKQIFFILLIFISFQGFSQSVKVPEIGLEVMTIDLAGGWGNWNKAKKGCADLGGGWRLPSKDELIKIYQFKNKIGGFENGSYWSSTEFDSSQAWSVNFGYNGSASHDYKPIANYVRAVRTLK